MRPTLSNYYKLFQDFKLEDYFSYKIAIADKYPNINKIVIVANHVFYRLPAMIGLIKILPFSPTVNCSLAAAGSLFYRVTIERLCPLKFSLLSCFGAFAYTAKDTSYIPLAVYAVSVLLTVYTPDTESDSKPNPKKSCCES